MEKILLAMAGKSKGGYEVDQSLLLNSADSSYLTRTLSTPTASKWTFSTWIKIASTGSTKMLFTAGISTSSYDYVMINSSGSIQVFNGVSGGINGYVYTGNVITDTSKWYHLTVTFDPALSSSSRMKIYVNGTEQSITVSNAFESTYINTAIVHAIGVRYRPPSSYDSYFNGYIAETHFTDGTAYDANAFGEFNEFNDWIPKKPDVAYGTNGFYLDYANGTALGNDVKGSNNWTPVNLDSNDIYLDSPTDNFAVLDRDEASGTFTEGNLKFVGPSSWSGAPSTLKLPDSGKWYSEFLLQTNGWNNSYTNTWSIVGLSSSFGSTVFPTSLMYGFTDTGFVVDYGSTDNKSIGSAGDVIGVSIDMDTGSASLYRNGSLLDTTTITDTSDLYFVIFSYDATYGQQFANFGQNSSFGGTETRQFNTDSNGNGDFYYEPPEGALALCRDNTGYDYWNVGTTKYSGQSFSVASQDGTPVGLYIDEDGTKMFILGLGNDRVYQYTLSTPWNISTASYDNVNFSVGSQDGVPLDIYFKPDGTTMYMMGGVNDAVYQYTLSTPWNVSTASYSGVNYDLSGQDISTAGIKISQDGTKMYMAGHTGDSIYQYTLSTPWNVSTASYDNISFYVGSEDVQPQTVYFKPDGSTMYMAGYASSKVYQYTLSTPWNISTASYDGVSFSTSAQGETVLRSVVFNPYGSEMLLMGSSSDTVYQYSIG